MKYYEFVHSLGLHSWDIPALIVVLIIVIVGLVHTRNQKKREKDFEEERAKKLEELKGTSESASTKAYREKEETTWPGF